MWNRGKGGRRHRTAAWQREPLVGLGTPKNETAGIPKFPASSLSSPSRSNKTGTAPFEIKRPASLPHLLLRPPARHLRPALPLGWLPGWCDQRDDKSLVLALNGCCSSLCVTPLFSCPQSVSEDEASRLPRALGRWDGTRHAPLPSKLLCALHCLFLHLGTGSRKIGRARHRTLGGAHIICISVSECRVTNNRDGET